MSLAALRVLGSEFIFTSELPVLDELSQKAMACSFESGILRRKPWLKLREQLETPIMTSLLAISCDIDLSILQIPRIGMSRTAP